MSRILGISAYYHDSAAALVIDGEVVCAAQEERFTRRKHDWRFPRKAVAWCLSQAGLSGAEQLDQVVYYDKPLLKFDRLLSTWAALAPRGMRSFTQAMPLWLKRKLWLGELIGRELSYGREVLFTEHHEAHAASAFFPSPFPSAAILTLDGVGEWATASVGHGAGNQLELLQELRFPHSLGLLYSAFTAFAGFRVNDGEYKLMGLAPYGTPRYAKLIRDELVEIHEDGSLRLNPACFDFAGGQRLTNERFDALFKGPPRTPEGPLTAREMDLAASIQLVTEEVMLAMARHAHRQRPCEALVLAGGVALNCVGNGRILREGPFRELWIQPAAGDAGGALGAALFVHHQLLGGARAADGVNDRQRASLLGPSFSEAELERYLTEKKVPFTRPADDAALTSRVAATIAEGKVVGWFQGPMEFGPRALGARSILGDARDPTMQARMNLKIKDRESFRPFAPAVLREKAAAWFELEAVSPYMLLVADVQQARRLAVGDTGVTGLDLLQVVRSQVPAVTHVNFSARVQTVEKRDHPLFHQLLTAFDALTGCPVIINTSFNVRDEPIVCSPADAYRCFVRTEIDAVVLGPFVLEKGAGVHFPEPDEVPGDELDEEDPHAARELPRRSRQFGGLLTVVLGVLGGLAWRGGQLLQARALGAAVTVVLAAVLVFPRALIPLFRLATALTRPISRVVSPLLLGLCHLAILTPIGLMLRLRGKRPLELGWRDGRSSSWSKRTQPERTLERYRRGF